ncbi:lysophospholipid acyltransferase family protein [Pleomorphovibrio marinus]|uniref:lysophospholipid acyltransferase family protein n=1 Tax=Pleomorphovibrio marinus TaxID=2164132 RepID=UPI000E0A14BA|nr:lysophospholipid acyltransferase family protein [Pleomorphovibrio marinus]
MFFFKLISYFPISILYLLTDFLFLIAYYVLGYRKKVVTENIAFAFPEKSEKERTKIQKKFYRNLTDSFAETLKLLTLPKEEINKRYACENLHLITGPISEGKIIVGYQAHFFNWEGHVLTMSTYLEGLCEVVYLKLNTPFFDRFMRALRGRFGATLTERNQFVKQFIAQKNRPRLIALAADQRPQFSEIRYWSKFMHRDAAFFEGGEKLAKRFNCQVIYGEVGKIKRGHYRFTYHVLANPPYDGEPTNSITEKYIKAIEKNIQDFPDLYLWSHNRWKEKKPV